MRVYVSDPRALYSLSTALLDAGCLVARTSPHGLEVHAPWKVDDADATDQTELELRFFLRAWEDVHPGVAAELSA